MSENKYIKVIADENELKWWHKYAMPTLKPNEIYFVSMSIRKKRLSSEQRKVIPHNEMWNKQQIRHQGWEAFIKHIRRLEVRVDSYFPHESADWINEAVVCYFNICPIDAYSAMKDQLNHLNEVMTSLTDSAIKNSKNGLEQSFYKVRKSFDTSQSLFARNFGEKCWIDFDIDFDDQDYWGKYELLRGYFNAQFGEGNTIFVRTGGGIHCLVRRSVYNINPNIIYDGVSKIFPNAKEIVKNDNQMIPLPGTWMYGDHSVCILNKQDITEEMRPQTFSTSEMMSEEYSKVGD